MYEMFVDQRYYTYLSRQKTGGWFSGNFIIVVEHVGEEIDGARRVQNNNKNVARKVETVGM